MELRDCILLYNQPGHGKEVIKKGDKGKCIPTLTTYPIALWKFYPYLRNGVKNISFWILVKHSDFSHPEKPIQPKPDRLPIDKQLEIWKSIDNSLPFTQQQLIYSEKEKELLTLIQKQ